MTDFDYHDVFLGDVFPGQVSPSGADGKVFINILPGAARIGISGATAVPIGETHQVNVILHDPAGGSGTLQFDAATGGLQFSLDGGTSQVELSTTVPSGKPIFDKYQTATTTIDGTIRTISLGTERVNTRPDLIVSPANNVTVNSSGIVEMTYRVSVQQTVNNNRSQTTFWLERDNVEEPGTRSYIYSRNILQGFGTATVTLILNDIVPGEVFRIRGQKTAGGGGILTDPDGTSLTIKGL